MRKPNFFIVGAPKCGTTALSEYLRTHPEICFSTPKEPHFFSTDFSNAYRYAYTEHDYLCNCFKECTNRHIAVGEGSVLYLYSDAAIKNIMKFDEAAKIIVMLRNPVDFVYAFYSECLYGCDEDTLSFQEAWNKQPERQQGRYIPEKCLDPKLLQYRKIGKVGRQLERVYQWVPREQVRVIFFEDFISQTEQVYNEVLSFLGVSRDERHEFPKINESKLRKLRWLAVLVRKKIPIPLIKAVLGVKEKLGIKKLGVLSLIERLNTRIEARPALEPAMQKILIDEFRDDINLLSDLSGRDMSHWINRKEKELL